MRYLDLIIKILLTCSIISLSLPFILLLTIWRFIWMLIQFSWELTDTIETSILEWYKEE